MTFGALDKGERFRIWRGAGTGTATGVPATLGKSVYTKVGKGICATVDGRYLSVLSGTSVERIERIERVEPEGVDRG